MNHNSLPQPLENQNSTPPGADPALWVNTDVTLHYADAPLPAAFDSNEGVNLLANYKASDVYANSPRHTVMTETGTQPRWMEQGYGNNYQGETRVHVANFMAEAGKSDMFVSPAQLQKAAELRTAQKNVKPLAKLTEITMQASEASVTTVQPAQPVLYNRDTFGDAMSINELHAQIKQAEQNDLAQKWGAPAKR